MMQCTKWLGLALSVAVLSACDSEVRPGDSSGGVGGGSGSAEGDGGGLGGGEGDSSGGSGSSGGANGGGDGPCESTLSLTIRDFTESHPDFQAGVQALRGLVKEDLGADQKPVYAPDGATAVTAGQAEFDQWYRDVDGVNQRMATQIEFSEESPGVFVYDNPVFFPIDGMGFGNGPGDAPHNYLFTTEAHTLFSYSGGEVFTFRGDDDLFVFINGKLAVDLGGVHGPEEATIELDAEAERLGIQAGMTYPMDIFHAERHTVESNFRIQTTIDLSCIENVPVI